MPFAQRNAHRVCLGSNREADDGPILVECTECGQRVGTHHDTDGTTVTDKHYRRD